MILSSDTPTSGLLNNKNRDNSDGEIFQKSTITRNGGIHDNYKNGIPKLPNSNSINVSETLIKFPGILEKQC